MINGLTFDGSNYEHERDNERLTKQYLTIFNFMKDGKFRTLKEIESYVNYPQASISAQLRHMRKERFGAHTVNKNYLGNGLYQYQLLINKGEKE